MVHSVSEDKLYDTIEFNEFLKMMSKLQDEEINMDALIEAFKYDSMSLVLLYGLLLSLEYLTQTMMGSSPQMNYTR